MAPEVPLNPDRVVQKFEGIVEHGEGAAFLDQSSVDERFNASVALVLSLIDKNTYLEDGAEKQSLKQAVLKQLMIGLDSIDARLEVILRGQLEETDQLKKNLYEKAVTMVADLGGAVGRQINKAADFYHIDDTEFKNEVLGQVPYMIAGIPAMDYVAKARAAEGKGPKEAMQSAATQYLTNHPNPFDHELVSKRYPELTLPEQTYPCIKIRALENLRSLQTGKVERAAAVGEVFQVLGDLPPSGKYTYQMVQDKRGNVYKICTNDGNHVMPWEYSKGSFHPPESATAGMDVSKLAEPLRTVVENGYATVDGTLTSFVNPLSINQVLPPSVKRATIIFNQKMNGTGIPQGIPVNIARVDGNFVFEGQYEGLGRSDGKVRVYEGDQLLLNALPTPEEDTGSLGDTGDTGALSDTSETLDRDHQEIPYSVSAYWHWMRSNWEAPNVIEEANQAKAVCAGYVQRTLEGLYGHDFAKEVFIKDGRFVDAWELAGQIENSGYGHTAMSFEEYYSVDHARQKITVDDTLAGYNNDVVRLMRLASQQESRTGVLFMHYKQTQADPKIIANLNEGGSLNSHAMLILGPGARSFEAPKSNPSLASAVLDSMEARLGRSFDDSWEKNRYLLGTLKAVKVNGVAVAFSDGEFRDPDGNTVGLRAGDKVSYVDTQVTDFYHSEAGGSPARVVGLTETMIQGNFDPVKLSQWDKDAVDNKTPDVGDGFIVGEFRINASVKDFRTAILENYGAQCRRDPAFQAANPVPTRYADRCLDFFLRVHVINTRDGLPIMGTRIPIFDWSKKPERPPKPAAKAQADGFDRLAEAASDFFSDITT